jgi:outer membrane protein TolC
MLITWFQWYDKPLKMRRLSLKFRSPIVTQMRRISRLMVLIGMWLVTDSLAIGQPTTQQKTSIPVLTREQAEAKALEANYGITLQKILTTSAEVNVNRGLAGQLPTVTMGAAQTYSNNSIQQEFSNPASSPITRSGAGTTVTTGNITLNWTLFDGMAMFINYDRLKLMRDLEQEQGRATVELTIAQVRLAFDNILLQHKKRALLEATLSLSKERMALADQRYQVGTGSKLDLLNAQVDYNTDRTALMAQEQQCTQAQADLNVLLTLPSETPFIAQGDLALKDSIIEANLAEQLKAYNNNLKLARFQREVAWQEIKLANSAR